MEKQIRYTDLNRLSLSGLNVRKRDAEQDLETLAASIEAQGVLVPLIVRPLEGDNGERFEILAGQRRFLACQRLAEKGVAEPLPCLVIEPGDDAKALDISLAENMTQLPMHPMEQYEAFAKLVKLGFDIGEIAARYGVTERIVRQRLALAKLVPELKQELQKGRIGAQDIQTLTMASAARQREWVKLYRGCAYQAPRGISLRQWICGGADVATDAALFPLDDYSGPLLSDLFGDKTYFGDSAAFWALQNAAIDQKKAEFEKAGWSKVVIWQKNQAFPSWEHEPLTKARGGWVFIVPKTDGVVEILKGMVPRQLLQKAQTAARKEGTDDIKDRVAAASAEEPTAQRRGEITASMVGYLNAHKQAAVRLHLSRQPGLALRVAVAAMLGGLETWTLRRDADLPLRQTIEESVRRGSAFQEYRRQLDRAAEALGLPADKTGRTRDVLGGYATDRTLAATLARLIELPDDSVFRLLAAITAETLPAGSGLVEALGRYLDIDMRQCWRLDDAFLDLLIDKEALSGLVEELDMPAGKNPKCADLRATVKRRVNGEGCKAVEGWLPGYLEFPPRGYTGRFNAPTVEKYAEMANALGLPATAESVKAEPGASVEPDPDDAGDGGFAEAFERAA